jgi:hypothetical protein
MNFIQIFKSTHVYNLLFFSDLNEQGTQTAVTETTDRATQCQHAQCFAFSVSDFINDDEGLHFYSGLGTYSRFKMILYTLGPAAEHLNYFQGITPTIDIDNQFFLTLLKLRQHKTNFEISRLFKVNEPMVTSIFVTWINFMYAEWGELNWWPSRDLVRYFTPTDFKLKFPTTRVIIDGTECPIMKPKQPILQQATFSTYKNRNTVKVLVGCSPGGLVSFCSHAFGGTSSDRQIAERSALRTLREPGDSIMADKGFNVQDLFVPYNVSINIPTFFAKKNRMSGEIVMKDRKIASKRVHIERIIGLAKTFKILREPMNNTESNLATQILQVCFYLCNFRAGIVPKDA